MKFLTKEEEIKRNKATISDYFADENCKSEAKRDLQVMWNGLQDSLNSGEKCPAEVMDLYETLKDIALTEKKIYNLNNWLELTKSDILKAYDELFGGTDPVGYPEYG